LIDVIHVTRKEIKMSVRGDVIVERKVDTNSVGVLGFKIGIEILDKEFISKEEAEACCNRALDKLCREKISN
jgi:hypothetical protein